MTAPLLLAALLAAAPEPAPAGPFAGCEVVQVPEHGWRYACEALQARTEDRAGGYPTRLRALWDELVPRELDEELERWAEQRRIAGQEVQVRRFRAPALHHTVWTAAVAFPEGTRLLRCEADDPGTGCTGALEALAALPWQGGPAAGTVDRTRPLSIGGRPVVVPADCTGEFRPPAGGSIDCPLGYWADWWTVADEAAGRRVVAAREARLERSFVLGSTVWHDAVRCRLAGAPATCQRWLGDKERRSVDEPPSRAVLLIATVRAGGEVVVARCFAPTHRAPGRPCDQLFHAVGASSDQDDATPVPPAAPRWANEPR
jgi:hypothetical protein